MATHYKISEQTIKEGTLIFTGLLGVDVVAVFTLLMIDKIDLLLTISLYAAASAIPFLALSILATARKNRYKYTVIPWYMDLANDVGSIGSVIALGAIFWHFSWIVALVFGSACICAFVFMVWFDDALKNANKNDAA